MTVVSLSVKHVGDPDNDLVTALEGLLVEARSGELQGIAYAVMYSDGTYKTDWDGRSTALPMYGAICMLSQTFGQQLDLIQNEKE